MHQLIDKSVWKKINYFIIAFGMILLSGMIIGFSGARAALGIAGICIFTFLLFQKPVLVIAIWIITAPLMLNRIINLGAGVPDITVDRILLVTLLIILIFQFTRHKVIFQRYKLEDWLLIIVLIFGLISIMFISNVNTTRQLFFWFNSYLLPIMIYYLIILLVQTEKDIRVIFYFVTISLLILTFFTPIEYITGKNILGEASQFIEGTIRVRSFTGSAWVLGAFAGMFLPLTSYIGYIQKSRFNKNWQNIAKITTVFGVLGIFLTFMRAAWLSIFICISMLILLGERKPLKLISLLCVISLVFIILYPKIKNTVIWQDRITGEGNIYLRLALAKTQLGLFLKSPIIGQGIATLPDTFYIQTVAGNSSYSMDIASHNTYATPMLELGLFGALYLFVIIKIIISGFKLYFFAPSKKFWGKELIAVLLGSSSVYLIQAATFEIRFFPSITMLFWIILALFRVVEGKIKAGMNFLPIQK